MQQKTKTYCRTFSMSLFSQSMHATRIHVAQQQQQRQHPVTRSNTQSIVAPEKGQAQKR